MNRNKVFINGWFDSPDIECIRLQYQSETAPRRFYEIDIWKHGAEWYVNWGGFGSVPTSEAQIYSDLLRYAIEVANNLSGKEGHLYMEEYAQINAEQREKLKQEQAL